MTKTGRLPADRLAIGIEQTWVRGTHPRSVDVP